MNLHGKTICFLGDSITEGTGASEPKKCFVSLFAAAHPQAEVYNYGVGGTRLADQSAIYLPQFEAPFYSRTDGMVKNADIVCVFGGTNDFGHGDAPFGKWGDKTPSTFCGALYKLSENLINKYPFGKIVFFTPLHRDGEENASKRADGSFKLSDYVCAIKRNAQFFSFPLLDLWSVSGMQPAVDIIRREFMPDGLHPCDAGHERLFQIIDAFISAL